MPRSPLAARLLPLFALALLIAGCPQVVGSSDAGDVTRGPDIRDVPVRPDSTAPPPDTAAMTCESAVAAARAFIQSSQSCMVATDCETVSAPCYPEQQDCCVVYLARGRDNARWNALSAALMSQCGGGGCGCCAAIPAPPGCVANRCVPMR